MEYIKIDGVPNKISRIAFGCAIAPMIEGKNVHELLDACLDMGITTFDTAENYGLSEISLGNWIHDQGIRDKVVIISKGCHPYDGKDRVTPEDLIKDIEASFARLQTDYIDIYFMHRDDFAIDPGSMVEILNEYYRKGKIGAFGGSNWTHERIEQANMYAKSHNLVPFTVSSPNFGLADQIGDPFGQGAGCVSISGPKNKKAREWYIKNQMPVFAYSSLGRGFFSGKVNSANPEGAKKVLDEYAIKGYCYPDNFERLKRAEILAKQKHCTVPQLVLAWTLTQPVKSVLLASSTSADRMRDNLRTFEIRLTPDELLWLDLQDK